MHQGFWHGGGSKIEGTIQGYPRQVEEYAEWLGMDAWKRRGADSIGWERMGIRPMLPGGSG